MNTALWVLQIILAIKLISVSFTHGSANPYRACRKQFKKMGKVSRSILTVVAACTFLEPWD